MTGVNAGATSITRNKTKEMVPSAGIEPATPGLGNRCSTPLSYEGERAVYLRRRCRPGKRGAVMLLPKRVPNGRRQARHRPGGHQMQFTRKRCLSSNRPCQVTSKRVRPSGSSPTLMAPRLSDQRRTSR
jgi:hypothetical protein